MKLGEVYYWETDQAQGHPTRRKYHVFICPACSQYDNLFLFINTSDWYCDYGISQANYPFLAYDSFISCNKAISYSDEDLIAAKPRLVGKINKKDLKALRDALIAAETMEQRDLNIICAVLASII